MTGSNTLFSAARHFMLSALTLVTLAACQAGGPSGGTWDYAAQDNVAAQQPPGTLSDLTQQTGSEAPSPQAADTASSSPAAAAQPPSGLPPVKVGLLLPLSGPHKTLGQAMQGAAQMAVFDIGHTTFELMPRDTGGTAQGAQQAAEQLIRDGAQILLGPVFAAEVAAVKPLVQRANLNMIAFSTDWTLAGGNTFIMGFLPFDQVERITSYAAAQGLNRAGLIAPASEYGRAVSGAFQTLAPRYGIRTVRAGQFAANETGLEGAAQNFANGLTVPAPAIDAVLMPVGGRNAALLSDLLAQNGLAPRDVRRLGTGLFDDRSLASARALDGSWFAAPSPKARAGFERRFLTLYGSTPPRIATLAYDATALTAILAQRGMQSQGRPAFDATSIMNPNGFAGIDGIFRFRRNGMAERGLAVLGFRGGQIVVIDEAPGTFQTAPAPAAAPQSAAQPPQIRYQRSAYQ